MDSIQVKYEADISKLKAQLDALEKEMRQVDDTAKKSNKVIRDEFDKSGKSVNNLGDQFKQLENKIIAAFAVDRIIAFGKAIIDTRAEFQKFEAVLTNTLGSSSAAQKALSDIKQFASQTPFSVKELTDSFIKLANQGFKPTQAEMKKLGDLASSTGKSFNQLTEAIIDAQTGEFERLKEFGIRAQKEGDKVKFTFKGVKTEVDFTNDSIRNYILSLGDATGVSGSMEAISKTLGGQISNLGDSFDSLLNTLGENTEGIIGKSIGFLNDFVQRLEFALKSTEQLRREFVGEAVDAQRLGDNINKLVAQAVKKGEKEDEARQRIVFEFLSGRQKQISEAKNDLKVLEKQLADLNIGFISAGDDTAKKAQIQEQIEANKTIIALNESKIATLEQIENDAATKKTADDERQKELEKKNLEERKKNHEKFLKEALDREKNHAIELANIEKRRFLDKEISEDELNKRLEKITEDSRENEIQILKRFGEASVNIEREILDKQIKDRQIAEDKKLKAIRKTYDAEAEFAKQQAEKGKKSSEDAAKRNQAEGDAKKKREKDLQTSISNFAFDSTDKILNEVQAREDQKTEIELQKNQERTQNELTSLDDRHKEGLISDGLFELKRNEILKQSKQKEAEIKTKDAQNDKKLALFRIVVDTAAAIVKSVLTSPQTFGLPFSAFAAATGALQAGIVASRPIPKFAKGTIRFKGRGSNTSDSNLAFISNNESIINAQSSIEHEDDLEAANKDAFRKGYYQRHIENKYVLPKLKELEKKHSDQEKSTARNIHSMVQLMKNNEFYDGNIIRAINRKNTYSISNVDDIARAIAKKTNINYFG